MWARDPCPSRQRLEHSIGVVKSTDAVETEPEDEHPLVIERTRRERARRSHEPRQRVVFLMVLPELETDEVARDGIGGILLRPAERVVEHRRPVLGLEEVAIGERADRLVIGEEPVLLEIDAAFVAVRLGMGVGFLVLALRIVRAPELEEEIGRELEHVALLAALHLAARQDVLDDVERLLGPLELLEDPRDLDLGSGLLRLEREDPLPDLERLVEVSASPRRARFAIEVGDRARAHLFEDALLVVARLRTGERRVVHRDGVDELVPLADERSRTFRRRPRSRLRVHLPRMPRCRAYRSPPDERRRSVYAFAFGCVQKPNGREDAPSFGAMPSLRMAALATWDPSPSAASPR